MARPIVFLTDYGLADEFVGTCHGVIARIAPDAHVIDLSHAVRPHDVAQGAVLLAQSVGLMPEDAVFLAVVDPGVGTARRPIAVRSGSGRLLVGPDNGLLSPAWDELGGADAAVEITSDRVIRHPVSMTFHGRDVFAPAAAHLAAEMPLIELGPSTPVEDLAQMVLPEPDVRDGEIRTVVLAVDRFGNVQMPVHPEDLERAGLAAVDVLEIDSVMGVFTARRVGTFDEVGEGDLAVYLDSRGWVAIAVNRGSAAESLGLEVRGPVILRDPSR